MAWKDPEIVAVRAALAAMSGVTDPGLTFAERRPGMDAFGAAAPVPEGCQVEPITIAGRPGERLTPRGAAPGRTILYLHGGGYCIGSPLSHRALVARLAEAAGATATVPDYRMGPEDPFPAAVNDALAAYRALLDGGADPKKLVIGGDSAGGGLTFATALAIKAAGLPQPAGLHAISPWANLTQTGAAYAAKVETDPMITKAALDDFAAAYLAAGKATNPLASPVFGNLADLAPVLIQVGGEELLLSDSAALAERIGLAGGDVTLRIWPEMIHVWHFFAHQLAAGRAATQEAGAWIKARMS